MTQAEQSPQNLKALNITELRDLINEHPWFSYARHLLLIKLATDAEAFQTSLNSSAIYLSSRAALYVAVRKQLMGVEESYKTEVSSLKKPERERVQQRVKDEEEHPTKPKFIVVGGDYFSKEDFEELASEEDMEEKLKDSPFYRPERPAPPRPAAPQIGKNTMFKSDGSVNFDDLAFYTETLGHIYAEQGYYKQAEEVFSKLILLYPQKSTYFATLVKKAKEGAEKEI